MAEQWAWHDDYERRHADRVVVDPGRALPEEYDETFFDPERDAEERATLVEAYLKARQLGRYATHEEIAPLLTDVPVPVLRDIIASVAHRQPGTPDSVASTFARAAELLEAARVASMRLDGRARGDIPNPGRLLGEVDVAFITAIREGVADSGGELLLPPVPALPGWINEDRRTIAPILGWLRLAVGDTSGELLHSPGCTSVRSRRVLQADHLPWWLVMLKARSSCAVDAVVRVYATSFRWLGSMPRWTHGMPADVTGSNDGSRWRSSACSRQPPLPERRRWNQTSLSPGESWRR